MKKNAKHQLILILLMPEILALLMLLLNILFKTQFYSERFLRIVWIIPIIEVFLIFAWFMNTYCNVKISKRLRFVLFNGIFLWGIPVGITMVINNYSTNFDFTITDGFIYICMYIITGVFYGLITFNTVNKREKHEEKKEEEI